MNTRKHTKRSKARRLSAICLGTALIIVIPAMVIASGPVPTKGHIPPEAFVPGQGIDERLVPDFIEALGPEGDVVGYVSKVVVLSPDGDSVSVYADDLKTVVGHMVSQRGFVPIGESSEAVPKGPVLTVDEE